MARRQRKLTWALVRQLERNIADLQADLVRERHRHSAELKSFKESTEKGRAETDMLRARTQLMGSIGQSYEAISRAVVYIVGKEVL